MKWHIVFEDKRGIKTVYAIEAPHSVDAALQAEQAFRLAHPEWNDGEDYWLHRVMRKDVPEVEGTPI